MKKINIFKLVEEAKLDSWTTEGYNDVFTMYSFVSNRWSSGVGVTLTIPEKFAIFRNSVRIGFLNAIKVRITTVLQIIEKAKQECKGEEITYEDLRRQVMNFSKTISKGDTFNIDTFWIYCNMMQHLTISVVVEGGIESKIILFPNFGSFDGQKKIDDINFFLKNYCFLNSKDAKGIPYSMHGFNGYFCLTFKTEESIKTRIKNMFTKLKWVLR
jgi:hypothetical protein